MERKLKKFKWIMKEWNMYTSDQGLELARIDRDEQILKSKALGCFNGGRVLDEKNWDEWDLYLY